MAPRLPDLKIAVIGAGMGGAATALGLTDLGFKDVTIYESAPAFGEVGAGIQVGANLSRLLSDWGVLDITLAEGCALDAAQVVDGATDKILSTTDLTSMKERYGHPAIVAHRAALHRSLIKGCERGGVKSVLNTQVVGIDFDGTRLQVRPFTEPTAEPKWIEADVIIAADGVKSVARAAILAKLGEEDHIESTGQAAYRILLSEAQMKGDPELEELLASNRTTRWIAERSLVMAYPISEHKIYNIVSAHPDTNFADAPSATWTSTGSKEAMLKVFEQYNPRVQKLLNLAPDGKIMEWSLKLHRVMKQWSMDKVALVGDACHPTLPHLGQGAAQAVEDGAVIAEVLAQVESKDQLKDALKVYQLLRQERVEGIVLAASESGKALHLGSGSAQKDRDAAFAEAAKSGKNPDKFVDKSTQDLLFGHDCRKVARESYAELYKQVTA